MHILEIPSFFPPLGGAFSLDQAKALQARGHEVRMIVCNQLGIKATPKLFLSESIRRWEEDIDGIRVYSTNMYGIPRSVRHNQKRWCRIIVSMYHDYVAKYGRPDILHAHCCKWAGVAASIINDKYGVPFYITEHIPLALYERDFGQGWTKHSWAKELLTKTYSEAACVIPVAKELIDDTRCFYGDSFRWKEISNTIDTDFFAFRERNNSGTFRFCCIANGNEIQRKGFDVLCQAFENFHHAELHIAGPFTATEDFKSLFKKSKNVVFHGELNKKGVRDLLYQCDAFVLASRSEVQPLVLLESMSTGIPVVCTEVTPMSERIAGACLIARTGDADSLREKMQEVMEIKPSNTISDAIKELASPSVVAEKLTALFQESLKNNDDVSHNH